MPRHCWRSWRNAVPVDTPVFRSHAGGSRARTQPPPWIGGRRIMLAGARVPAGACLGKLFFGGTSPRVGEFSRNAHPHPPASARGGVCQKRTRTHPHTRTWWSFPKTTPARTRAPAEGGQLHAVPVTPARSGDRGGCGNVTGPRGVRGAIHQRGSWPLGTPHSIPAIPALPASAMGRMTHVERPCSWRRTPYPYDTGQLWMRGHTHPDRAIDDLSHRKRRQESG